MSTLPENRRAALTLLTAVLREHKPLEDQAEHICRRLDPRDRAFVRMVVATTLRRIGQIDGVINRCLDRPMPAKLAMVRDIIRLGVAQMVFLDTPAHAVVDTAVELVKDGKMAPYAGLTNALLRRVAREGKDLAAAIDASRLNTPRWLWTEWVADYGEMTARAIGQAHLGEAPLDITLKPEQDSAQWAERLEATVLPTGSLRRLAGGAVQEMAGFSEGAWWVQDAAAALPVRLLGDVRGLSVLDLCAAPGGKTVQLASRGAHVTAIDRSARRLRRVTENLTRLGLTATIQDADATEWRPEQLADAVLLDAPCSATGTIRRHPDVARLKTAQDVTDLAAVQADLLRASAEMVKPGGLVVYCTCSLQKAEGERQIEAALAAGVPFAIDPIRPEEVGGLAELITPEGYLRTLPSHIPNLGGLDGFFAARLRRL